MFIVASVDRNWAIGKNGDLLYRIPVDLANFSALTQEKTIVYGRKTLDTFPDGKPLKGRTNVILTRDEKFSCGDATIIHDLKELEQFKTNDVYIVGGESLYNQLYEQCYYAFVTHIDESQPDSDAFFPNLPEKGWKEITHSATLTYNGIPYWFATYRNPILDDVDKRPPL